MSAKLNASGQVELERPLCKYPEYPRYNGAGDQAAAESYTCTTP